MKATNSINRGPLLESGDLDRQRRTGGGSWAGNGTPRSSAASAARPAVLLRRSRGIWADSGVYKTAQVWDARPNTGTLDEWAAVAERSPFVLDDRGVLVRRSSRSEPTPAR